MEQKLLFFPVLSVSSGLIRGKNSFAFPSSQLLFHEAALGFASLLDIMH